jgi:hypothetical protein
MTPDYPEILRLYRKYRACDGEPMWRVFVRVGEELEGGGRKERCRACGRTDLVYSRLVDPWCSNPWHADAHLRRSPAASNGEP